jgi:hypothetical protein
MTEQRNRARQKRNVEVDDFKTWLASLEGRPILHVNGSAYSMAVLTVDFGTPLQEIKIDQDLSGELTTRMRAATRSLCKGNDANIRIQTDTSNGIWFTSIG